MKRNMRDVLIALLVSALTLPAMASDENGYYSAKGARSCGDWVMARKENNSWDAFSMKGWIAGYFTAFDMQTEGVYSILGSTGDESVYLWMDKYCQENPLKNMGVAMEQLTSELWPNRKTSKD